MKATLDLRDICPMDFSSVGKLFLADLSLGTKPADIPRHNLAHWT